MMNERYSRDEFDDVPYVPAKRGSHRMYAPEPRAKVMWPLVAAAVALALGLMFWILSFINNGQRQAEPSPSSTARTVASPEPSSPLPDPEARQPERSLAIGVMTGGEATEAAGLEMVDKVAAPGWPATYVGYYGPTATTGVYYESAAVRPQAEQLARDLGLGEPVLFPGLGREVTVVVAQ